MDSRDDGHGLKDGSGGTFEICSHRRCLSSRLAALCELHFKS